ncbi:uncharacterized protein LOC131008288 [Salvia miltiorrhiza]|uniref:uncharacterized protein LOC131008288 n=1 Tax=Salvia miltiorrhiza TaxID=226208 RepID=UPI0025ACB7B9|nr:uncharacterized protein LOC131008288 [Salvia miltiorrhiza]
MSTCCSSSSPVCCEEALIGKFPHNTTHYYFTRKYARLQIQEHCKTNSTGVYQVRAYLLIQFPYWYGGDPPSTHHNYAASRVASRAQGLIRFWLEGLWSDKSRQLLMVGSAPWVVEGNPIILDAVLDLNYTAKNNPILYNSYISGSLKSTVGANDPGYFDPLSIFSFPVLPNYNYSLLSQVVYQGRTFSSDSDVAGNSWLTNEGHEYCWVMMRESIVLEVEYGAECREAHCSPLDGSSLPRLLLFTPIQCSAAERKLRYIATFQNTKYGQAFGLNSTVIGEASWDDDKKELFGIACRFLDPLNRSADEQLDCTMRLSLSYTSIFTVRNEPKLAGRYWSTRHRHNSTYFPYMNLTKSDGIGLITLPDVRYEYTKLDQVSRSSCVAKKRVKKGRNTYPDVLSGNMRFDLSVENSRGQQISWGSASPLWVGNDAYMMISGGEAHHTNTNTSHSKISYMISLSSSSEIEFGSLFTSLDWSTNGNYEVEITAEGVYDAETGYLCMVGCRKVEPYGKSSAHISGDCEILVTLQFSPLTGKRGGRTKGTITSTRARTDPLHFHDMIMSSAGYYVEEAARTVWRMDMEVAMVLISNTLVCVFVGLQIRHVRRYSMVPSSISLLMLLILSVAHMLPLIFNLEDVHSRRHRGNGGRLEANEAAVRLSSLAALLLQLRLLQLVWTAKQNGSSPWGGERKPGCVLVSLYVVGGLLGLVWNKYSVWGGLRYYGGLIVDGFLVPQVVLNNGFLVPQGEALVWPFYVGISAVRVVPHAYDVYRAHNYPAYDVKETYYYANPDLGFYSRPWDVVVPFGIIALVLIIFLQQRSRGCGLAL